MIRDDGQRFSTFSDFEKAQAIAVIRELGPGFLIEISREPSKRSIAQNNLMHALFRRIAKHTGDSVESVKAWFKRHYLGTFQYEFQGEVVEELIPTSKLSVKAMEEFITQIMCWCVLNGLEVDFQDLERTRRIPVGGETDAA